MAVAGCKQLVFFSVNEKAFYFEECGTDLLDDSFEKSTHQDQNKIIQSQDNKCLILTDNGFQGRNLTEEEQHQSNCKFNVQFYKDNAPGEKTGRAVVLYAIKDGKKIMVCCNENHEIYPEEAAVPDKNLCGAGSDVHGCETLSSADKTSLKTKTELPDKIGEIKHRAVFFRKKLAEISKYTLESSMFKNEFLGFQPDESDGTLSKLILFPCKDELDRNAEITFTP